MSDFIGPRRRPRVAGFPKTPHRPQGPRPAGSDRPANCELSPALRSRILQAKIDGRGYKAIARQFNLSRSTIQTTIRRNALRTSGISKPREGRPRTMPQREIDLIYTEIHRDPDRTIQSLYAEFRTHVSQSTFRRALRSRNLKKWKKLR